MLKELVDAVFGIPSVDAHPGKVCVVYSPKKDIYVAFIVDKDVGDQALHNTIVANENKNGKRDYTGVLKPGSFNFVRISNFSDKDDATDKAKAKGLVWEPIKTVLARHLNKSANTSAPDEPLDAVFDQMGKMFDGFGKMFDGLNPDSRRPPGP